MDDHVPVPPRDELQRRHGARRARAWRYAQWTRRLVLAKRVYLASFIGYAVFDPTVSAVLVPVFISVIPLVLIQHLLTSRWARHRRAASYYARALDRLSGDWIKRGDQGQRYADYDHPYAQDLDLFGRGSLFQLLCTACTAQGEDMLARWLKNPGDADTVIRRQDAVRELCDALDAREELDAAGAQSPVADTVTLEAAAQAGAILPSRVLRVVVPIAAWFWMVTLVMSSTTGGTWQALFLCGLACEIVAYLVVRHRILAICQRGYQIGSSLTAASGYAQVLTARDWQSPLLRDLQDMVQRPPRPMPRRVARIIRLLVQLPAAWFLAVQLVPPLESRFLRRVRHLPEFWDAIAQCEVLSSLAAHTFEHPDDAFPQIVTAGPCFDAQQLGHPVIEECHAVRNDVRLDRQLQMLMVSGSNMSGKSTLLRAVGVNAVLALAGAPVRAHSLHISPMAIGAAMRFQDSLEEGTSYFYNVLTRLRRVLELLSSQRPLLFLFDEILQGTNSHDRLAGAEAVIRRLLGAGAIGLVTTHDLELTQVAEHLAPAAANVHFVDTVIDGQLHFDYRMRKGVVQSSNAIHLMREFGLDV